MTTEEQAGVERKIDNEIVDSLCPFIKSAFKLMEEDNNSEFTYAYLLLLSTGIERLQKIIYILKKVNDEATIPSENNLRKLAHDIAKTYRNKIKPILDTESLFINEEDILNQALTIVTEIIMTLRYANFDFINEDSFDIPSHLVKIIDKDKYTFEPNVDYVNISKNILNLVLKKYIASLVNLIWNKKVNSYMEVSPLCLKEFIIEKYLELDLHLGIQNIIDEENEKAKERSYYYVQ